jgi:hypothetical protein
MMSWGMSALFLIMPMTLQGIKNKWASKILFFELLVAQAALAAQTVSHVIAGSPVSCQALILTFLVIKCFLQTSVVFWRGNFKKKFVL